MDQKVDQSIYLEPEVVEFGSLDEVTTVELSQPGTHQKAVSHVDGSTNMNYT